MFDAEIVENQITALAPWLYQSQLPNPIRYQLSYLGWNSESFGESQSRFFKGEQIQKRSAQYQNLAEIFKNQ